MNHSAQHRRETLGMWLGVLGVATFAVTLPMTRLATGTVEAPQMSAWFITFGRAVLAGALSIVFLLLTRSPRPTPAQRKPLFMAMLGNAIFFPLLLGFALRHVTSGHAAVFTALLPLATAAMSAWVLHQRARLGFWVCAGLGAVLVMAFSLVRAYQHGPGFGLQWADLLLLGAVIAAAFGYVSGAQESVLPMGTYDAPAIINQGIHQTEGAANNYSLGHFENLVAIGEAVLPNLYHPVVVL